MLNYLSAQILTYSAIQISTRYRYMGFKMQIKNQTLIILILLWRALLNFSPVLKQKKSVILLSIDLQLSISIHSAKLNDSKVPLLSNSESM